MLNNYDFLCGNDFTWVKIALRNDDFHTLRAQAEFANTIDFSGDLRNLDEIIIDRCPKFTQILWPEQARSIKRLKIGNCSTLTNLDLSALVNLEELSIINCKKLIKIKGLGGQVTQINIQGCKLNTLDVSSCKKITNFILKTHAANLQLHFKQCNFLQSAIIQAEDSKADLNSRKSRGEVSCVFEYCTHLNTLKVEANNALAHVDITGCCNLKTGLFSPKEHVYFTGTSSCPQLNTDPDDLENKRIEIDNYILKSRKNALKMPGNPEDVETIIQQNGIFGKKGKSCLVKFQLLMQPRRHSYIYDHERYLINNYKVTAASSDLNFPNVHDTNRNKPGELFQKAIWLRDNFEHFLTEDALNIPQPHYLSDLKQSLLNDDSYADYSDNKSKRSYKPNYYLIKKAQLPVYYFLKHKFYKDDLALVDKNAVYRLKNQLKDGLSANSLSFAKISSARIHSVDDFLLDSVIAFDDSTKSKLLKARNEKDTIAQDDSAGVYKKRLKGDHLEYGPILDDYYENEQNPLSSLDVEENALAQEETASQNEMNSSQKAGIKAAPLLSAPDLAEQDYGTENGHLFPIDLRENVLAQKDCADAKKTGAEVDNLLAPVELVSNDNANNNVSPLRAQEEIVFQNDIQPSQKSGIQAEPLLAAPPPAAYENEQNGLASFAVKKEHPAFSSLTAVEKAKAEANYLVADPVIAPVEAQDGVFLAMDIKADLSGPAPLTSARKEQIEREFLEKIGPDLIALDNENYPGSLLNLNENHRYQDGVNDTNAVNKEVADPQPLTITPKLTAETIQKQMDEAPEKEDFSYLFPICRSLVDLKPRSSYLNNNEFEPYYLTEMNNKILKDMKNYLDQERLGRAEKVTAQGSYLTAIPTLATYDSVNTFLIAVKFQENIAPISLDVHYEFTAEFEAQDKGQNDEYYTSDSDFSDMDFDAADFLGLDPEVPAEMSDDMLEVFDSLTDEERELLFPKSRQTFIEPELLDELWDNASKPELEINLKRVAPEHTKKLLQFFDAQSKLGIKVWSKDQIYAFYDGTEFTFKNDIFQRARKGGHEGVRYETISNRKVLGEGGFGKVIRIKGTVALDSQQELIQFKKQKSDGRRRVVKVQEHSEFHNPLSEYQRGFAFAQRADHLAIKEPTVIESSDISQRSYTVMDEISGRDLFDINTDDFDGIDVLTTDERIELTKALLLALKEQVTDKGFVHRDIKPENIIVNLGPPIVVKIIDYDLSMDTPDGLSVGTEGYYAPEVETDPMSTCAKSDVYSMARVIALVWRVDVSSYIENDIPYTPSQSIPDELLTDIFNGITDLSDLERMTIENTLACMLATDHNQRFTIEEAIQSFSFVGTEEAIYGNVSGDEYPIEEPVDLDVISEPVEFDVSAFLNAGLTGADISDDMKEVFDSMTEEERDILFPQSKPTSYNPDFLNESLDSDVQVVTDNPYVPASYFYDEDIEQSEEMTDDDFIDEWNENDSYASNTDVDAYDLAALDLQIPGTEMSDDMREVLDSMTEEEMELLYPKKKQILVESEFDDLLDMNEVIEPDFYDYSEEEFSDLFTQAAEIIYDKDKIAPLIQLIEEQCDSEVLRQTVRVLFTSPYYQISGEEAQIDPFKPSIYFQLDETERLAILRTMVNQPVTKQILFEELFGLENQNYLSVYNDEKINDFVTNGLLNIKKSSAYSSTFFQQRADEYSLAHPKNSEENQLISQIFSVDSEADQDIVTSFLKSKFDENPEMIRWNFDENLPQYLNDFVQKERNLSMP